MAITKQDEDRIGGKFCKRPLRQLPSTPYERPPSAIRGTQPANEAGRSRWFSNLVDSAAQIIVKGVPRLFSSVFGKGQLRQTHTPNSYTKTRTRDLLVDSLSSQPTDQGENINTIEEVAEMKSSPEVREKRDNHIDITISIDYDGSDESKEELISHIDAFFQLKEVNKKKCSRAEIGQLGELLYSKTMEIPGCQKKKKVEINNNSNTKPSSSHQIREEDFANFFNFSCKSQINQKDCQNKSMTQKVTRKSEMYKMARSTYFGSSMRTNTRVLKRRRSDRDEQCFDDAQRVPQKSCLKDLNLATHADISSKLIILDQEQKGDGSDRGEECFDDARRVRQKTCLKDLNLQGQQRIDSKGLNNSDCEIHLASDLFAPPIRSVEMAKKILYELNKL